MFSSKQPSLFRFLLVLFIGPIFGCRAFLQIYENSSSRFIAKGWVMDILMDLSPDLSIPIAVKGRTSKLRKFDLGSHQQKILVECKNHNWTAGGNIPSAKMSVWNEAMYYFHAAPPDYKKLLFVPLRRRPRTGQSLAEYYIATYKHLIPRGVEIWEYDEVSGNCEKHKIE